jgi:alkyl hydroperoxide reductase subunit F
MSLTCHNCPDVVQALQPDGRAQPAGAGHVAIDGGLFQEEVEARQIMAVPSGVPQRPAVRQGRMELAEILAKVDTGAAGARPPSWRSGPLTTCSSSAAARPAPRRRCTPRARASAPASWPSASAARRMDTLGIENYISVLETEGPKFAAALEAQVRHYGVDVMTLQRVAQITPAGEPGGLRPWRWRTARN